MPPFVDVGAGDVDCGGDGVGDVGGVLAVQTWSRPEISEYPERQTHVNPNGAVRLATQKVDIISQS